MKFEYILHDCEADSVRLTCGGLELTFSRGIYTREHESTDPCRVTFAIKDFDDGLIHISACEFRKDKRKEMSVDDFVAAVNKNKFRIDLDLYCDFVGGVLLKGYVAGRETEVFMTEVESIDIT